MKDEGLKFDTEMVSGVGLEVKQKELKLKRSEEFIGTQTMEGIKAEGKGMEVSKESLEVQANQEIHDVTNSLEIQEDEENFVDIGPMVQVADLQSQEIMKAWEGRGEKPSPLFGEEWTAFDGRNGRLLEKTPNGKGNLAHRALRVMGMNVKEMGEEKMREAVHEPIEGTSNNEACVAEKQANRSKPLIEQESEMVEGKYEESDMQKGTNNAKAGVMDGQVSFVIIASRCVFF